MRNRAAIQSPRDRPLFYQQASRPQAQPQPHDSDSQRDDSPQRPGCAATLGTLLLLVALLVGGVIVFALLMDYSPADVEVATGESRRTDTFAYKIPGDWQVVDEGNDFAAVASIDGLAEDSEDGGLSALPAGEYYIEMTYRISVFDLDPAAYLEEQKAAAEAGGADYSDVNDEDILGIGARAARLVGTIEHEDEEAELGSVRLAFDFEAGLLVMVGLSEVGEVEALEDYMLAIARTVERP
jgi:hypothetical protein